MGLAIAAELSGQYSPLFLLERRSTYGQETSSRNSEVIHAGIYYPHDSLKAQLCVEGKQLLYQLCAEHDIPHRHIGKIITATRPEELDALERLYHHGLDNGTELRRLAPEEVHALEPNIRSVGGILSPSTGIISAHGLMDFFYRKAKAQGTEFVTHTEVVGLEKRGSEFVVTVDEGETAVAGSQAQGDVRSRLSALTSRYVVNSAGLESDTIARLAGVGLDRNDCRLHWAKGSYFAVGGPKRHLVSRLVYPMPPTESLGVHAVIDLGGGLRFGPDVEYLKERTLDYSVDSAKHRAFGEAVRQIVPSIADEDLTPDLSGIRAKLQARGEAPRDFLIRHEEELEGFINLIGIDSPGLTASPAIARYVHKLLNSLRS